MGIGAISAVAPAFVSECSPKEVRGRITGMFQIMVAVGVMLSYWINRECYFFILTFPRIFREGGAAAAGPVTPEVSISAVRKFERNTPFGAESTHIFVQLCAKLVFFSSRHQSLTIV